MGRSYPLWYHASAKPATIQGFGKKVVLSSPQLNKPTNRTSGFRKENMVVLLKIMNFLLISSELGFCLHILNFPTIFRGDNQDEGCKILLRYFSDMVWIVEYCWH